MAKPSFILHLDSLSVLGELTDEQAGKLFKAIVAYNRGEVLELDQVLRIAFNPFKNQFDRDMITYNSVCERNRENGKMGGRPPQKPDNQIEIDKPKETQTNPKNPDGYLETQTNPNNLDNDNEKDSEKDKDKDSVKEKDKEKEKRKPPTPLKGVSLPFESENFKTQWVRWKEYKRVQHSFNFKGADTEQTALNKLFRDSGKNEIMACAMIDNAIANGWKGIFTVKELQQNGNGKLSLKRPDTIPPDVWEQWSDDKKMEYMKKKNLV